MKLKNLFLCLCLPFLFSCQFNMNSLKTSVDVSQKDGLTYQTFRKYLGYHDLPSTGNSKMLVIPVVFSDCSLSEQELKTEHEFLEKTFFGKSEDTYWESVSSFYQKSSYNNLNITGKVSDYFYYNKTIYEANKVYIDEKIEPTYPILLNAINWYNQNYDDLSEFDSDGDSYIDSVWLIYMEDYYSDYFNEHPEYQDVNNLADFLWAYTYWYDRPSDLKIKPFSYSWGSYQFSHDAKKSLPDAHTFIHETGHLLGLDDYYNYDYTASFSGDRTKPIGGLDMMDLNILDHCSYSKFLLNWIKPTVVGEDEELTLNAFQNNGEAIIVPVSSWSGSPLDEYLILELYTPTGLNEEDSTNSYCNRYPKGFDKCGVKIYHVDSRLGLFTLANNSSGIQLASYLSSPNAAYDAMKNDYYIDIVNSNTPSFSYDKKLITLLSSTNVNVYYANRPYSNADNTDLYKDGAKLKGYTFHQYKDKDLTIEIDNMSFDSCSIKISGIGK